MCKKNLFYYITFIKEYGMMYYKSSILYILWLNIKSSIVSGFRGQLVGSHINQSSGGSEK